MKNRWIFRLYNGLVLLSLPFIIVGVFLRWRKRFARGLERWSERWGRLSDEQKKTFASGKTWWWVHAVSLGEVKAIEAFLRSIPKEAGVSVVLSVVTPEALVWALDKKLADEIIAAPFDLPWIVRRVFRAVRPQLFVSVESEFWPNLLREAKRSGARVALVNGRISAHSYRSYKYIRSLLPALWECFDVLAVREDGDAARFMDLGVPKTLVQVTGNFKYDLVLPPAANVSSAPVFTGRTIVVGSSREEEEKLLLPVMEEVRAKVPNLRILWAPRHIDRLKEIESLFTAQSVPCARKSVAGVSGANVLWDSVGDLVDAYRLADVAVIGGSFVSKGGQNPLEPAVLSVPVVFGPSMENFQAIAETLLQHKGAKQVTLAELSTALVDLLTDSSKRVEMGRLARQALKSRQGASERTLHRLKELVHA